VYSENALEALFEFQRDWARHEICAALATASRKMLAEYGMGLNYAHGIMHPDAE
jgi:hypothetical protein